MAPHKGRSVRPRLWLGVDNAAACLRYESPRGATHLISLTACELGTLLDAAAEALETITNQREGARCE